MSLTREHGMLTEAELRRLVAAEEIDTVVTAFPDMYGRLLGKRVDAHHFVAEVLDGGAVHACDYLFASDIEMEPVPGYRFASWEQGYGDFRMVPDLATLRLADWLPKTALVLCDAVAEEADEPVAVAPRSILRRQVERAAALGYVPKGATEVEFYLFRETYDSARAKGYQDLVPFGDYIEDYHILQGTKAEGVVGAIRRHMARSGVPVECSKGEWGPGQQEVNLRYAELLEMADRHTVYKHAAKEIAWQHGAAVTFMAKWREDLAGSSMHVHLSLWDAAGAPLFPGDRDLGAGVRGSDHFAWFLGGWIQHAHEIAAFYAPYPTSYKRYQRGSFAPVGIGWGYDNRTLSFRIVGHGAGLRIECRAPGADANPYLVFAASLAAGLDGIERRIEPPPPVVGNAYASAAVAQLPRTLGEAVAAMAASGWLRSTLGDAVVDHYAHFFRSEQERFDGVVTDWERRRYFERA